MSTVAVLLGLIVVATVVLLIAANWKLLTTEPEEDND
jgi:uncharacterized membrane protein